MLNSWQIRRNHVLRILKDSGIDALPLGDNRISIPAEDAIKGWDNLEREVTAATIETEQQLSENRRHETQ